MEGNLTLTVDEEVLRAARKIARERHTSVEQLVQDYLAGLQSPEIDGPALAQKFVELARNSSARVGGSTWTRDELHER
jgi:hypothetical protein